MVLLTAEVGGGGLVYMAGRYVCLAGGPRGKLGRFLVLWSEDSSFTYTLGENVKAWFQGRCAMKIVFCLLGCTYHLFGTTLGGIFVCALPTPPGPSIKNECWSRANMKEQKAID
jgi:hypothetical protein